MGRGRLSSSEGFLLSAGPLAALTRRSLEGTERAGAGRLAFRTRPPIWFVLLGLRVGVVDVSCGEEGDGFVAFVGHNRLGRLVVVMAACLLVFVGSAGQVVQGPRGRSAADPSLARAGLGGPGAGRGAAG